MPAARLWVCRILWSTVSRSPALVWACAAWVVITRDRLEAVRESDAILREEFAANGLEGKVWQYFTVVPDIKSVGVRDGKRADEWPCILRAVNTVDAMTATVEDVPFALLQNRPPVSPMRSRALTACCMT